jgi:hypothetical protein
MFELLHVDFSQATHSVFGNAGNYFTPFNAVCIRLFLIDEVAEADHSSERSSPLNRGHRILDFLRGHWRPIHRTKTGVACLE